MNHSRLDQSCPFSLSPFFLQLVTTQLRLHFSGEQGLLTNTTIHPLGSLIQQFMSNGINKRGRPTFPEWIRPQNSPDSVPMVYSYHARSVRLVAANWTGCIGKNPQPGGRCPKRQVNSWCSPIRWSLWSHRLMIPRHDDKRTKPKRCCLL